MTAKQLLTTARFSVEEVERRIADGKLVKRAVVRHPGAVTLIPLVDRDHVCLIRNFRVAVGQTLIELPAGTIDPPETPAQTAARELVEETGYQVAQLDLLHAFYLSPGILDERMHLFLAQELTEVGTAREPGEEIENLIVPWEEAMRLVWDHQIQDAKTIVGLLTYNRLRAATN